MAGKQGTKVKGGSTEVVTAGTAVRLVPFSAANQEFATIGVWVSADIANTESIVIGDSAVKAKTKEQNGVVISKQPTAPVFIEVGDPSVLFVDAQKEKEKASWLLVYA